MNEKYNLIHDYLDGVLQGEAREAFEAAMRADPGDVAVKVGAAKTWLALERMKEAKDLLKKLWTQYPGDPLVAYWLGRAEEALGN